MDKRYRNDGRVSTCYCRYEMIWNSERCVFPPLVSRVQRLFSFSCLPPFTLLSVLLLSVLFSHPTSCSFFQPINNRCPTFAEVIGFCEGHDSAVYTRPADPIFTVVAFFLFLSFFLYSCFSMFPIIFFFRPCLSSYVNTAMHTKERHIRRMLHMNSGRIHMRLILRDKHFNYNVATRVYLRVARSRYRRFY